MLDEGLPDDSSLHAISIERAKLMNVAFRMLGSTHEAEDVVQEAYARWYALADEARGAVESPTAWLVRVTSRICLDYLASARVRRERYTGEWLPEPLPDRTSWTSTSLHDLSSDPADRITLDESISMSLLVLLESVTPAERVTFILHDIFKMPFLEVSDIVGRSPVACRQLSASAKRHIQSHRHQAIAPDQHRSVVLAFKEACETGDFVALIRLLDPNVSLHTDGGGKVRAAMRPVLGADKTARLLIAVLQKEPPTAIKEENVNGRPGLVIYSGNRVSAVLATAAASGRLTDIWAITNPDKLHAWRNPC